ncbi:hypothetical protein F2Q68_00010077 [Brassica cretica]|uniref:Uncharacterized protein n=1 Tax=Brassica cretica TaxID=69181 RepID=A0A3N6QX67_BRACR|nr:hypothetical protein F2Q68_00010077 [Brassica cretica]
MGDGEHASVFDMSELWNRLQRFDHHDKGASCLAKFCNIFVEDSDSEDMLPGFQNQISDSLARTARSFHRKLCFVLLVVLFRSGYLDYLKFE